MVGHKFDSTEEVSEKTTDTQMHSQSDYELCDIHVEVLESCKQRVGVSNFTLFIFDYLTKQTATKTELQQAHDPCRMHNSAQGLLGDMLLLSVGLIHTKDRESHHVLT